MRTKPHHVLLFADCLALEMKPIKHIEKFLMKKISCTYENANSIILDAIRDGILFTVRDKKLPPNKQLVRFMMEQDVEKPSTDWFCFECFLPGDLTNCLLCSRAFHLTCFRKWPERPNYSVPATNIIAEYEEEDEDTNETTKSISSFASNFTARIDNITDSNTAERSATDYQSIVRPCKVKLIDIEHYPIATEADTEDENKWNLPDVVFMGDVRPPTRQRKANHCTTPNNSLKNEQIDYDEGSEMDRSLCTCCRLMESGKLSQPPNLSADELCHLLRFSFNSCRKWFKRDIYKIVETKKISIKVFLSILQKLFTKRNVMTLDIINTKIEKWKYNLLVEILIDTLEFQFTVGVLFGSESLEFDLSKYLIRDSTYDFSEIRRCPDCFRHSNERVSPMWFAIPCRHRHELVFAKCYGHSFWPAKVIRVLNKAKKYDVRFFGGNHNRSIISSQNIRPIEVDGIGNQKSVSFKKAMDELNCYRALAHFSSERFSYNVDKADITEIIGSVMAEINSEYGAKISSKNKRLQNKQLQNKQHTPNLASEEDVSFRRVSIRRSMRLISPPKLAQLEVSSSSRSMTPTTPVPISTLMRRNMTSTLTIEEHIAEMNALREQLQESHQRELEIAKRKNYCVKCLQPAKILCCIHAWYCSRICQRHHWFESHSNECCKS